jgi:hypothetical protein
VRTFPFRVFSFPKELKAAHFEVGSIIARTTGTFEIDDWFPGYLNVVRYLDVVRVETLSAKEALPFDRYRERERLIYARAHFNKALIV